ncbi:efflux RND transporter periplasmic adaptor subunit [Campylobacter gracilis]|uniref:Efflux transporter, RND family, MFP subunit n=1 Tax=Campylobacter gracilis RM3268 TaxID=553220 RepID=C8PLE0_9BACT|nr:efflux RND transporter periplasmic adaptor subunit [Campylobacter gracilis]AKT92867.1 macrolide-specific efflux protein, membrane fusion protein MacA [Campylobacter gracilis]EEV16252.1 efflux transporter, RND family, MFP subunit [Campylobacter gracilis RM3268]UEB44964.1 efflux RND transporter periplasmic adaptor subunit [Campylobacter gracilis]SUW78807.1 MacA [Campylobacter gracilis]
MKKTLKFIVSIVLIFIAIYFLYGKFFKQEEAPKALTTRLEKGDIRGTVTAAGEVYARDLVDVGAQVSGQIKKLYVKVGDKVQKGDMIAQIDSVTQENEIAQQKAQLLIHEANLASAKIAAANAKTQYNRELELYKRNAASKEAVENAKNSAALKEAEQKQIEAQIEQTKLQLSTAETNFGYTKITAPISGTIVSMPVEEGKTVNSNQTTPTIVKIADLSKMEIKMQIAEGDISKVKVGMDVEYSILSDLDNIKKAKIYKIDPGLTTLSDGTYDKTSSGSSSSSSSDSAIYFYAKMLVDNENDFLKIGMTTENNIIVSEANNTSYLPTSVIKRDAKGDYVTVLNGKEPEQRYVKTGVSDDLNTEILSGLDEKDEVLIADGKAAPLNMDGPPMVF